MEQRPESFNHCPACMLICNCGQCTRKREQYNEKAKQRGDPEIASVPKPDYKPTLKAGATVRAAVSSPRRKLLKLPKLPPPPPKPAFKIEVRHRTRTPQPQCQSRESAYWSDAAIAAPRLPW